MVTSPSLSTRQIMVALFAVSIFAAAGYGSYRTGQVSADTLSPSPSPAATVNTAAATEQDGSGTSAASTGNTTAPDAAIAPSSDTDAANIADPNTPVSSDATAAPSTTDSSATDADATDTLNATTADTADISATGTEPFLGNTEAAQQKPFYQDIRYIVLIIDAVLILGLLMALTFRLINRLVPATAAPVDEIKSKKRDHSPTVDELNMDIPL